LRNRCADVRQLDDVGLWRLGKLAEFGQRIALPLFVCQVLGEIGDDRALLGLEDGLVQAVLFTYLGLNSFLRPGC